MELSKKLGIAINGKRVERIMRENGLLSNVRRKKYSEEVYAARRALRSLRIPDLIGRRFFSFYPRTRFVEDITYLPALEGNLYLNTIEDMFNGEIVAWKISDHPDTKLCLDTVDMLASELGDAISGIILHSDCGSTYVSYAYRELRHHPPQRLRIHICVICIQGEAYRTWHQDEPRQQGIML